MRRSIFGRRCSERCFVFRSDARSIWTSQNVSRRSRFFDVFRFCDGVLFRLISFFLAMIPTRGFGVSVYHRSLTPGVVSTLFFQFLADRISKRSSISRVLGVALWVLGGSLFWFPSIQTTTEIYFYFFFKGAVGGVIAIVFYAIWGEVFGDAIWDAFKESLNCFGSCFRVRTALFAWSLDRFQSYSPTFQTLAPSAFPLGFGCYFAKLPRENEPNSIPEANAIETNATETKKR